MLFATFKLFKVFGVFLILPLTLFFPQQDDTPKVLIFSKTAGFRHDAIPEGIVALKKIATERGYEVVTSEDSNHFNENNLSKFHAVVFLNTTGDVLTKAQQNDFERFIQAGGSYMGVHSATDTEYSWPWYNQLVGAYFAGHPNNPNVRNANLHVKNHAHPSTAEMPDTINVDDEFYNFKSIQENLIKVLVNLDETSYQGGKNGANHPMSWFHEFDGGKAFYTGLGHTKEMYTNPIFVNHLDGALQYLLNNGKPKALDYAKAKTKRVPENNRFTRTILSEELNEPVELAVLPDERVLFIERRGEVKLFDPKSGLTHLLYTVPVSHKYKNKDNGRDEAEDGLLGLAIDPNFAKNGYIYMYHSLEGERPVNILTRWNFNEKQLDPATMKTILEVPVQRDYCCHTGGSIAFDKNGYLYLSTGDNSSPRATAYAPLDERPGKGPYDSQKGSSNTNDLRGKILRIMPNADGSYEIPAGNLFAPGTALTKPEIYGMGMRNPYRITIDQKTGYVYWGDVGPDASKDSVGLGPNGHDEVNQMRKPGFFGWPYFVGNNFPYYEYDFETKKSGPAFDPLKPINNSPNNTGLQELPPAQAAFIYYTYGLSREFPLVGTGGRTAMAGPVYYSDLYPKSASAFPDYYDGKLFIYEWMRGWVMAVTMDDKGNYQEMEPFIPHISLSNPMDMEFGPNGDMYVLEYGTGWFQKNNNARLIKISYTAGNRSPAIAMSASATQGANPMKVTFSSEGTEDYDQDDMTYLWRVFDKNGVLVTKSTEKHPSFTYKKEGIFQTKLMVTDVNGASSEKSIDIIVGNEPPKVELDLVGSNQSFFFPDKPFEYLVKVKDKEDGLIDENRVAVTIDFLKEGQDKIAVAQGHVAADEYTKFGAGKTLIESLDCKSCHKINQKSVGPSYAEVAKKYKSLADAMSHVSKKIITGGSGVWGDAVMAAHPTITKEESEKMAAYILSLSDETINLPMKGSYVVPSKEMVAGEGSVIVRASYEDFGANGFPKIQNQKVLVLNNPTMMAVNASKSAFMTKRTFGKNGFMIADKNGAYLAFDPVDFSGIKTLSVTANAPKAMSFVGGELEVRLDAVDGPLIGKSEPILPSERVAGQGNTPPPPLVFNVPADVKGKHAIYVVVKNPRAGSSSLMFVSNIKLDL